jgi:hypothetical protein
MQTFLGSPSLTDADRELAEEMAKLHRRKAELQAAQGPVSQNA